MRWMMLAALLAAALDLAAQEAVFRGTTDVVRVFATVTGDDGRLVTGLSKDDFEVRDEGKAQPITTFDNTPQRVRLIVMLDVSGSMEGNLPLLRGASQALFSKLRPDDVARVGSFGHDVDISSPFTRDEAQLLASLPRGIAPDAPTPLWRAAHDALEAFGGAQEVRAALLVLSDGKDTGPRSFREHFYSQGEIIDRARTDDVMFYGIGMRSRSSMPRTPGIGAGGLRDALLADLPDPGLALVAQETGGGYAEIRFGQDLGAAFERVADELHSQYLVGFAPPKRDGKVHDVSVRLTTKKGLKVRARKSYVAPKGGK
jgi:Ca-activated chloride channel family protein